MLPKALLTSHSKMSGSRLVITSSWLSGSWRSFLYSSSVYLLWAMLSKSLIQFSIDGWRFVPSLLFTWGQTMVEVTKIMATSFKRSRARTAALNAPSPAANHHWPQLCQTLLDTYGQVWVSLCGVTSLLDPGAHKVLFVPAKSLFPTPV